MKKLYYLICMVTVAIMASCNNEEESLFDQSSANRADASIKESMEVLTSAENGWLMKYFPAYQQEYGGYNLILSFGKDGKVKVANELAEPDDVVESYFSIKQSAGTILSFDTYNDLLHAFSDPSAPLGGSKGYGLEGDYDFSIMSASAEKVVLKGRKTEGYAILTPLPTGTAWSSYIEKIYEVESKMTFNKYGLKIDGQEIDVLPSNRTLTFVTEENGEEVSILASYIVTPEGFEFYEPVIVYGHEISGFKVSDYEEFEETNNSDIVLFPVIPPINEQFVNGEWFIAYSNLGTLGQAYWNYVKSGLAAIGEELYYAYLANESGGFGLQFGSFDGSGLYGGSLFFNYTLIGDDQITLQFAMTGAGDGVWYHNNANFAYALFPFGYSTANTFTLTTDDIKSPSYIVLTDNNNANNVITLTKSEVIWPFDY